MAYLGAQPNDVVLPLPVSVGGTGATSASTARTNLGIGAAATNDVVPVAAGGTGGTTQSDARTNLGISFPLPLTSGGTGATDAATARTNLGLGTLATQNTISTTSGGTGGSYASPAAALVGMGCNVEDIYEKISLASSFTSNNGSTFFKSSTPPLSPVGAAFPTANIIWDANSNSPTFNRGAGYWYSSFYYAINSINVWSLTINNDISFAPISVPIMNFSSTKSLQVTATANVILQTDDSWNVRVVDGNNTSTVLMPVILTAGSGSYTSTPVSKTFSSYNIPPNSVANLLLQVNLPNAAGSGADMIFISSFTINYVGFV